MRLYGILILFASIALRTHAFDCSRYEGRGGDTDEEEDRMYYNDDEAEYGMVDEAEPDPDENGGFRKLQALRPVELEDFMDGAPWQQHLNTCDTPTSNARGHYTSNFATCSVRFHKSDTPDLTSSLETSDVCSDDNAVVDTIQYYIRRWRDECVGDFTRCYIIERDERIFLNTVCRDSWAFPEGATHISVNCEEDKIAHAAYVAENGRNDPSNDKYWKREQDRQEDQILELERVVFSILTILIMSCLGCLSIFYCCAFKPYHTRMKAKRDRIKTRGRGETFEETSVASTAQVI